MEKEMKKGNILEFEGEYLNGQRYKGKKYNFDGKLEFFGQYLYNHKRKGEEYCSDGKI